MVILDITKSLLHLKTKRKPHSHALMAYLHIKECLLLYAMHLSHFKRCMMVIFFNMVENFIFLDDFSMFGSLYDHCLNNLNMILQRCEEINLVLNWEKCHFMVREGIVLGHKISPNGIEVDRAKVEIIEKLPSPNSIRAIRSFLGHVGFYRRFIKDFSKISKPLSNLLIKDVSFFFSNECQQAFETLKYALVTAPIMVAPDWDLPFELMCDGSDYALEAVLGHKISPGGIEVDKTKVEIIKKLPPSNSIRAIRSFLGYVGFYRRFIKDFSKIYKPLSNFLIKDVPFFS